MEGMRSQGKPSVTSLSLNDWVAEQGPSGRVKWQELLKATKDGQSNIKFRRDKKIMILDLDETQ